MAATVKVHTKNLTESREKAGCTDLNTTWTQSPNFSRLNGT